jgi:4-alpha-glucanotransferase
VSDARNRFAAGRYAGVLVPLFSIPSSTSWGIGEIPDLPKLARWLESAGLDFVQLLPVNEMAEGQNSPYSALSAMAIDPLFIGIGELPEFVETGGERSLPEADRALLSAARAAESIDYRAVRDVKGRTLQRLFDAFEERERRGGTPRGAAFRAFVDRSRSWLEDYALFRALRAEHDMRYWIEWEPAISRREPQAMETARNRLARPILYYKWLQCLAWEQWERARRDCGSIGLFGDFPFVVSGDSADVWARQDEFRVDASTGVPPDAFSDTGQDWGLPVYRWDVIAARGDEWIRQRSARTAEMYDGFRIDHLIGFYRTYFREADGRAAFIPPDEPSQLAQGERLMAHFLATGDRLIAEDLGTVPDFVRESLARLGLAGMKVMRWEREWHVDGQPFRDPRAYPVNSVATTGTHDTETVAEWWDAGDRHERRCAGDIAALREAGISAEQPFSPVVRDAIVSALFSAASELVLLPLQDVFGWRDRINTPALVSDVNWSWRLPWPIEEMLQRPEAQERAAFLRERAARYRATVR